MDEAKSSDGCESERYGNEEEEHLSRDSVEDAHEGEENDVNTVTDPSSLVEIENDELNPDYEDRDMETETQGNDLAGGSENQEVRRSKRIKTRGVDIKKLERERMKGYGLERGERLWKEAEKKMFLDACKEFGTAEGCKIAERVPTKPANMVLSLIDREKRNQNFRIETKFVETDGQEVVVDDGEKGTHRMSLEQRVGRLNNSENQADIKPVGKIEEKLKRRERKAPIEKWIDIVEEVQEKEEGRQADAGYPQLADYSGAVPALLDWIAELEPQPDPAQCGGVDYAALYHYLALLCRGEAPPDLPAASSRRLARLLASLNNIVTNAATERETEFLENYRGPFTKYTPESGWVGNSVACAGLAELTRLPGTNPLNLHPELLADRQIPLLDELVKTFSEEAVVLATREEQ